MFNYDVKIFPFKNQSKPTKAFASIIIEGVFEIKGFKVIEGRNGYFVGPPQTRGTDKQTGETRYYDDVLWHENTDDGIRRGPICEEVYAAIIDAYKANAGTTNAQNNRRASAATQRQAPAGPPSRPSLSSSNAPTHDAWSNEEDVW